MEKKTIIYPVGEQDFGEMRENGWQHGTGKTINRLYPRNLIRYIVDYLRRRYLPEIKITTYSIPSCWYILTPKKRKVSVQN